MKLFHKLGASALALSIVLSCTASVFADTGIDNSALMPKYTTEAKLSANGFSPDWASSLIMAQFRVEKATAEGTFQAAVKVLDHYQEMGVNGLWINPIFERSESERRGMNNGYGSFGPYTIDPGLTGASSTEESFDVVKAFVDEAHKRNIRIIFDVVVWGVAKEAPIVKEKPEFFLTNGRYKEIWGGYGYNWNNPEWRAWYTQGIIELIEKTGADGLRCDLEPDITGYSLFQGVRTHLYEKGHPIIIISEGTSYRNNTYDFEQNGVGLTEEPNWNDNTQKKYHESGNFYMSNNIVDSVLTGNGLGKPTIQHSGDGGKFQYYTYNLTTHDSLVPTVRGSRVRFGYQAVFAPFIPMWFIGEEWNNTSKKRGGGVMYFNEINWAKLEEADNKAFYEDIKKYIRIRRTYPELFEYFPENHRQANIVKVQSGYRDGNTWNQNALQAYARYSSAKSVLVVPNNQDADTTFRITLPLKEMGMEGAKGYKITDLLTSQVIMDANTDFASFDSLVRHDHIGVYLVEKTSGTGTSGPAKSSVHPVWIILICTFSALLAGEAVILFLQYKKKRKG